RRPWILLRSFPRKRESSARALGEFRPGSPSQVGFSRLAHVYANIGYTRCWCAGTSGGMASWIRRYPQHGGGGASTSLGLIAFRPSPQVNLLKSIGPSVAFSPCAQRLRLQKSS